ncbi:hypothetical protein [Nonomuraea rubra]|uniref:Uncharacterized protein n=1 Tax=Nonomuraea rubra TaxID=46180 RepID=A0A7X0P6X7_9ACTN|nr:hypothetical protein [Nonomuraea rubra]MBB6556191.1 hypothetical protein [Nonomuraea rubra]
MTPTEVIEKALREHLRLRLGKRALTDAMLDKAIPLSGREAEDAARIAVDALTVAGLVVVSEADCRHVLDRAEQFAMHRFDADDSVLVARLRAALDDPEAASLPPEEDR